MALGIRYGVNVTCPKQITLFIFQNNSVKNKPISIIFGTQTPEETSH